MAKYDTAIDYLLQGKSLADTAKLLQVDLSTLYGLNIAKLSYAATY
jgi:hypothetical protein